MILDSLRASAPYEALSPRFARAFQWLRTVDVKSLPDGRTDLDGDNLYVVVYRAATRAMAKVPWEAHQKYADIQYVAAGTEAMLWESLDRTDLGEYNDAKDFQALEAESWVDLEVPAGQFAVFFPTDAHKPGIDIPGADPVVKLVVKVKL